MTAAWKPSNSAIANHPAPFTIQTHSEWPRCDCTSVKDANGVEVCTVYTEHSAGVAQLIVDALAAFHEQIKAHDSDAPA